MNKPIGMRGNMRFRVSFACRTERTLTREANMSDMFECKCCANRLWIEPHPEPCTIQLFVKNPRTGVEIGIILTFAEARRLVQDIQENLNA